MSRKTTGDHRKPKNLIRSQYKDIMVKVDQDVYYLDRLYLALKSEYFEKLFIENYAEKNCELIEIPVMDTETFYAIVEIIYGAKLKSVIDSNNYVSVFMALDYLQMKIYPWTCKSLVKKLLDWSSPLNIDVFRLYHFMAEKKDYDSWLPIMFKHLSGNLRTVKDLDEFLPISFDHFIQIILLRDCEPEMERTCCKICAKWICHDLENRLPHAISLVNAIKYRLERPFDIDHENLSIPLPTINEHLNEDTISRYFYKLLEYTEQICTSAKTSIEKQEACWDDEESNYYKHFTRHCNHESDFKIEILAKYTFTSRSKLETFLESGNFCDIVVKAGEKRYKLHRSVLKSVSGYFEEILAAEYTEILAKCEGIPVLPSMDKEYVLNGIDQATFDVIIDHIYLREVEFSADVIVRLFKAADMLRIDGLLRWCESWMKENSEGVCAQDVIEILNFTHENVKYKSLNRFFLSKYVVDSWPEIGDLPQFADLFKAITVPEKISSHLGENKVYLFNNIDQATFQLIINYIYLDELDLKKDNFVRVLKASEIFKMKELMKKCMLWLTKQQEPRDDLNSEDLLEVLRFTIRNTTFEDLITRYLVKHIIQWPEIDNSLFCSFSYEALENILMSPDLYFNDPYEILDICSKWITHDMENRYHLVPRIALAISRNGLVDCNDCTIEFPVDLKNCSQDFVKGKLLEIISTTCVVPFAVISSQEKKLKTEQPIFITSKQGNIFSILNSNMDEITSLHICKYVRGYCGGPMSATMMNDNLFLICSIGEKSIFHVYNFSLKKLFSLALDSRIKPPRNSSIDSPKKYTLLNCCNEIYSCIENGEVLKYSFKLNRWKLISEAEPDKDGLQFTSDGHILYRMYKILHTRDITNYIMEAYNVDQSSWISLPNTPVLSCARNVRLGSDKDDTEYKLIFMNDFGFAVLFKEVLYLLNQNAERWQTMSYLPYNYRIGLRSIITQDESGEILYLSYNELHRFSRSDQRWQLKKELPVTRVDGYFSREVLPYENIVAIHKPIINT